MSRPFLSLAFGSLWLLLFVNTGCRTDKSTGGDGTLIEDLDGDGVSADLDCDDSVATVYPGAEETCNDVDDDCNDVVDDSTATDASTWYADSDGDGYGDPTASTTACELPAGYVSDSGDCDDSNSAVNPGAAEVCDDLDVDEDCNGYADEADRGLALTTWYDDVDGDGYGDASDPGTATCDPGAATVTDHTDCDDADASVSPAAEEVCDGVDNDCDGTVDVGARDESTYYLDADSDGYGVDTTTTTACSTPRGYADATGDCDDAVATTNPGAAEICGNGVDDDCSGAADEGCPWEHCGTISSDETWDASITHHVTCDVYVQGSSRPTLTIADGALVELDAGVGLYVGSGNYGDLQANGTSAGITMTSSDASPGPRS